MINFQNPSQGFRLNRLNFMNLRDYGKFMTIANNRKNHTILTNERIFSLPYNYPSNSMTISSSLSAPGYFIPDYYSSGNKICYASYKSKTGLVIDFLYSFKLIFAKIGPFGHIFSKLCFFGFLCSLPLLTTLKYSMKDFAIIG